MHQHRCALQSLHQVGFDGVLHQNSERPGHTQVVRRNRFTCPVLPDHDFRDAFAHVFQTGCQCQNCHKFRSHTDVIIGVQLKALFLRTLPDGDAAQHTIINIHTAPPGNGSWVDIQAGKFCLLLFCQLIGISLGDAQFCQPAPHSNSEMAFAFFIFGAQPVEQSRIALAGFVEHARVDRCSQQVVGSSDGVDVTGQVQVEVLHGDDLGVTTASSPAFDAKSRSLGWLTDASDHAAAQMGTDRLAQTNRSRGLPFAKRRGSNGSYVNIFPIRRILQTLQHLQLDFCLVIAIKFKFARQQTHFFCNLSDGFESSSLGDIDISRHWVFQLDWCGDKPAQTWGQFHIFFLLIICQILHRRAMLQRRLC